MSQFICPVCGKPIPDDAIGTDYEGCIMMFGLSNEGYCCTAMGTIRLGTSRDEFESLIPKDKLMRNFTKIRESQGRSIRIGRCWR